MRNVIAAEANYTSPLIVNKTYFPISISSDTSSFTIVNSGTAAAPCRLSFSPINDMMSLTITGLSDEPIVINRVMAGSRAVIDGINQLIQVDGQDAYSQFDGWEFPKLQPGNNTITFSSADQMSLIEVEFQPRYV